MKRKATYKEFSSKNLTKTKQALRDVGILFIKKKTISYEVSLSLDELRKAAIDFVNTIEPDSLINICEHQQVYANYGGSESDSVIVYYWEYVNE